jgi:hypothetical protein
MTDEVGVWSVVSSFIDAGDKRAPERSAVKILA